ncbi:MAG: DUF1579 domain-containing protein [Alphaproteobacteria bacterium]|jgi:hypothetical protein|nr:DUF1579 domain-containing protein [Alphaproteobacteria bacterium]
MMKVEITPAHRWLDRLVGEWNATTGMAGPDGKPMPGWTEHVRSLYGVWVVGETDAPMPHGRRAATMVTLGYDSARGRYVGTWIGSMMDHLWVYDGALDASGNVLTLDTEGPDFGNPGGRARYQDIVTFLDDDRRTLTSFQLQGDGSRKQIMAADYRRKR